MWKIRNFHYRCGNIWNDTECFRPSLPLSLRFLMPLTNTTNGNTTFSYIFCKLLLRVWMEDASKTVRLISLQLLSELKNCGSKGVEGDGISDELLSTLGCVFQTTLPPALELVDKHAVTKVQTPSGRTFFKVSEDTLLSTLEFTTLKCHRF